MAYANEYGSGINLTALMIPTRSAVVFAAQEQSLYLPGNMVPIVEVGEGSSSIQVATMGSVVAQTVANNGNGGNETDPGADLATTLPANTRSFIDLDLIAARSVIRDLGRADFNDFGRILGNSVAKAIDTKVSVKLGGLTAQESLGVNLLDEMFKAIGSVRAAGETGALNCVVSATAYAGFMSIIGSSAYAGGETQNAAMRSGFIGNVAGVPCYVSAYLTDGNTGLTNTKFAVFSADAMRMAMQGGVKVEFERRAAAVGTDIVASAAFGVDILDATRGIIVQDAV
jgi:hypothetical protein